jgi:hypothetical protein
MAHRRSEAMIVELWYVLPIAFGVDDVGANETLTGLAMDEAIGVGAVVDVDALGAERVINAVETEAVARAFHMAVVGAGPEGIGPGHQGSDSAFCPARRGFGFESDGLSSGDGLTEGRSSEQRRKY